MTHNITEDQIKVLNAVRDEAFDLAPAELLDAVAECLHEGFILASGNGKYRITAAGSQRLTFVEEKLFSMNQLRVNERARIAFVSQRSYERFQRLRALGLATGVGVSLCQRVPSFVVKCEETEIALEEDIARDIFVWRES